MKLNDGKIIAEENGLVYLFEAESNTAAYEENGGVVVVPSGTDTSKVKATEGSTLKTSLEETGYTIEGTTISQPSDIAGKVAEVSGVLGSGTEIDPFVIYDYATMQVISDIYKTGKYAYYKVCLEKTDNGTINCANWYPVNLHGSFDGSGVKFINVDAKLFNIVGYGAGAKYDSQGNCTNRSETTIMNQEIELKNFDATLNIVQNSLYSASAMIGQVFNLGTTIFTSITVHGYLEGGWNNGSFYNYGSCNYNDVGGSYTVKFNDCHSDATIVCTTGNPSGGFVGHGYEGLGHTWTMIVDDKSSYTGTMYGVADTDSAVAGNKWFAMCSESSYILKVGNETISNSAYANKKHISKNVATKNSDGYYVTAGANASKVVVNITAQMTAFDTDGNKIQNLSGITMGLSSKTITNISSSMKVLDAYSSVEVSYADDTCTAVVENGVLKIVLPTSNYQTGTIRLQITQYDNNNNVVCAGTLDMASRETAKSGKISDCPTTWTIKE